MALEVWAAPGFKAGSAPARAAGGGSVQVIVLGWTTEKIRWFLKNAGGSPLNVGLCARN